MKFMVLMAEGDHFANWDRASEETRQRVYADFDAFSTAVAERGTIVAGEALDHPRRARTVQPRSQSGGDRPVTEGPYAETVEQLGGFFLIDVASFEDAVELAKLLPREYLLEVREVLEVETG